LYPDPPTGFLSFTAPPADRSSGTAERSDRVGRVGEAEVDVAGAVPGDGLVGADGVVLEPVGLGVLDELEGVVDLLEVEAFVLQAAEAAFA